MNNISKADDTKINNAFQFNFKIYNDLFQRLDFLKYNDFFLILST